ncbi:hypothetical protein L7F22_005989 [Adiantum nelumboides]|nr:hypothetical protein [Adiantum nelumboides]
MADQELPSSSRLSQAPPRSSNADLLHTIAQLREQRASFSTQAPAADYRHGQGSLSSQASSSGRRRLCKVRSNDAHIDSPVGSLYNDLEDWQEEEAIDNSTSADLADSLDKLSITTDYSKEPSDVAKPSESKPKQKIMDSLAFLNEARKLSASEKANRRVVVAGDGESIHVKKGSDVSNLHDAKREDHNDMLLLNKPSLVPKIHGGFASKSIQNAVCWDMEDEKENSGGEAVTFVHNKLVFKLPQKIANILYPHQHEGIKWLWGLHVKGMGGILGDDMGLGKTMQIASFFVGLFTSDLIKHALIVAPKTLIAHWAKELSFVGLGRKTKDYSGTSASQRQYALQHVLQLGGILLTTYDVVRNNWQALRGDFHGRDGFGDTSEDIITWDYMVLDEGHLIKNPSTQRAKSLKEIPCAHRIVLSGTPIQNNLREMWALFDFCCPELLGDRKEFKARYEDTILSANSKDSTDRQKRAGSAVAQGDLVSMYFQQVQA